MKILPLKMSTWPIKTLPPKICGLFFTNVPDGKYRIISYHINQEHGSLLDEWGKMEFTPNLGSREIYYLQHAVHPNRIHTTTTASGGQLIFNIHLMPLEVIFAEIQWVPEEGGKAAPF